jgi:ribonucleoside-diphosphate reductase alpha chain
MENLRDQSYATSAWLGYNNGPYQGGTGDMPFRRNLNCQVIAPTGTISRLAGCSFGIEPHFDTDAAGNYMSFVVGGQFTDHNQYYNHPSFKPASQVTVAEHIATQAAFQKYNDQGISKTVNAPFETTREQIEEAYITAWESGCKGTTVLREWSRCDTVIGAIGEKDCVGAACAIMPEDQGD